MSLSTSAKLIKGGFIGLDPDNGARYRASSRCTIPRHAHAQSAGEGDGRRSAVIAEIPLQVKTAMTPRPSFTPVRNGLLQRRCAGGGTPGATGECEACRKKSATSRKLTPRSCIIL